MSFDLNHIEDAAKRILSRLASGELQDACCMSAASTPVKEAWDAAEAIVEEYESLTEGQQQMIFSQLSDATQAQLIRSGYDDFDLVYERLLQLIEHGCNRTPNGEAE